MFASEDRLREARNQIIRLLRRNPLSLDGQKTAWALWWEVKRTGRECRRLMAQPPVQWASWRQVKAANDKFQHQPKIRSL